MASEGAAQGHRNCTRSSGLSLSTEESHWVLKKGASRPALQSAALGMPGGDEVGGSRACAGQGGSWLSRDIQILSLSLSFWVMAGLETEL